MIDGDTLVYNAALATEVAVDWGDDLWTLHSYLNEAIRKFEDLVTEIKTHLDPDRIVFALSDGQSVRWRNGVMPSYKMNRKKVRRPLTFKPLRAYCHEAYETFERAGLEGDDVLGILATRQDDSERIIVSIDKDMKTIPGKLFNYGKPELGVVEISEDDADYQHMVQTLSGDSTDGYPGCPKIGPVTAEKLLAPAWKEDTLGRMFDVEAAWEIVVTAYKKAGLNEEVALQNARVARILRASDYNFAKKEVILWEPW